MSTFRVTGQLNLDGSRFASGLSRAEIAAKRFGGAVTSAIGNRLAGLFALGAIERVAHKAVETADELVVASQRLGIGIEQLQILRRAAQEGGAELDGLAKAFERIDIARAKALQGGLIGGKFMQAFGRLGISEPDVRSKTSAQLFMGQMAAMARTRSVEDVGPMLREILGRSFGEMLPVLKTDFDDLSAKMQRLGAIASTESTVELHILSHEVEMFGQIIVARGIPALVSFAEGLYHAWVTVEAGVNFLVGLFHKLGPKDFLLAAFNPGALANIIAKSDLKEGTSQATELVQERVGLLSALRARAEEEANRLRRPAAPFFDVAGTAPLAKVQGVTPRTDTLLQVGNFLGQTRNSLGRLAERQLAETQTSNRLLTRIADSIGQIGADNLGLPSI